jgi:hypothetical protein
MAIAEMWIEREKPEQDTEHKPKVRGEQADKHG